MAYDAKPYNPLDVRRLGEAVARALLAQPVHSLPPSNRFLGSGIYAIYYRGAFPPYAEMASRNATEYELPIYIGKGIPSGSRTGGEGLEVTAAADLFNRLRQHANSIAGAQNLELADFGCRYLVVAPVWIPLAEELLIRWFSPLWNTLVTGFGNNDPGGRRYTQLRSLWDVLHPGRAWAARCAENPRTAGEIEGDVRRVLARHSESGS